MIAGAAILFFGICIGVVMGFIIAKASDQWEN